MEEEEEEEVEAVPEAVAAVGVALLDPPHLAHRPGRHPVQEGEARGPVQDPGDQEQGERGPDSTTPTAVPNRFSVPHLPLALHTVEADITAGVPLRLIQQGDGHHSVSCHWLLAWELQPSSSLGYGCTGPTTILIPTRIVTTTLPIGPKRRTKTRLCQ